MKLKQTVFVISVFIFGLAFIFALQPDTAPVLEQVPYKTMHFAVASTDEGRGSSSAPTWIAAQGIITTRTPGDFRRFLQTECAVFGGCGGTSKSVALVIMNSPGGNLLAGLELGRMIRSAGLSTRVARTRLRTQERQRNSDGEWVLENLNHIDQLSAGRCESACAYAFLGGVNRSLRTDRNADGALPWRDPNNVKPYETGVIGLHRFREMHALGVNFTDFPETTSDFTKDANEVISTEERIQRVTGQLIEYIEEMGVDPKFFTLASNTASEEMTYLSEAALMELNVLTGGFFANWKLGGWTPGKPMIRVTTANTNSYSEYAELSFTCLDAQTIRIEVAFSDYMSSYLPDLNTFGDARSSWERSGWVMSFGGAEYMIDHSDIRMLDRFMSLPIPLIILSEMKNRGSLSPFRLQAEGYFRTRLDFGPIDAVLNEEQIKYIGALLDSCPIQFAQP